MVSQHMNYFLEGTTYELCFFERTAKTLLRFLLDEERKKKANACLVFFNENWAQKSYNRGECSTHPNNFDITTGQHMNCVL